MTFERASILEETIEKLFSQTVTPEKIIIIDNSFSKETEELIVKLNHPKVVYHSVGYNSGPAGAAAIGLKMLADEGYDWIYWGDDDDPPHFDDTFETLLKAAVSDPQCGCVGSVGQFLNRKTGFIKRVPDAMLDVEGILEVDTISGNQSKIISGAMVSNCKILPTEKLFFGFEELEFDLQINKAGYKLLIDKTFFRKHRILFNRVGVIKKKIEIKTNSKLQREYYSTRNILYVFYKYKLGIAFLSILFYSFLKQFLRFKQGFRAGYDGLKVTFLAVFHFFTSQFGFKKIKF